MKFMESRIDFMFYKDGACNVANGSSLEEDQKEETEAGGEGENIVHHLSMSTDDKFQNGDDRYAKNGYAIVNLLFAMCSIDQGRDHVQAFIGKVFRAGVEYGRKDVLAPLIERTKKDGL